MDGTTPGMATTYRNLWPAVTSWDNLLLAYGRCRRRKRYKQGAVEFDANWESGLLKIQRELRSANYAPGAYRHFYVYEPKKRKISAAPFRDRIVHHAIVNVLEPIYERRFIHDSYACRRGKGTHRAIRRAQHYLRRHPYYLKTDIVKFFPNVDHEVLLARIQKKVADKRLLGLLETVIASGTGILDGDAPRRFFPGDDLFAMSRPRGLPIGNLTSQFFANVLLDPVDHYIKETLRVPGYVRYADDLLLFGDSKEFLNECRELLGGELAKSRLWLHPTKTVLRPTYRRLVYLGLVVGRDERRLSQDALRRMNRRLRRQRWATKHKLVAPRDLTRSLRSWLAHAEFANSCGIRKAIWKRVRFGK